MLVWLDSNSNVKGKPNENYARELMELFSLGVGHYTETGHPRGRPRLHRLAHRRRGLRVRRPPARRRAKTVLGQTGAWDGGDVVRIVLEQPAAARFLVRKLYRFLVSEKADPPDSLLEPLCESFRKSDYDIAALVRTILASRHFYSDHAFRQRIKARSSTCSGRCRRCIGATAKTKRTTGRCRSRSLVGRLSAMGQALFAPPNVKGWPGGRSWLNTSTVLERDNFAEALAMGTLWHRVVGAGRRATTDLGPGRLSRARPIAGSQHARGARAAAGLRPGPAAARGGREPSRGRRPRRSSICTCPAASAPRRGRSSWPSSPRASPPAPPSIAACARPSTPS